MKISQIQAEILQFLIYFSVFLTFGFLLIFTPESHVDNLMTYIMGVFSVLLLLQLAYVEKLLKEKRKQDVNRKNEQLS